MGKSTASSLLIWNDAGTLRENLDPFDQNDDAVLNSALQAAGLFSLQEDAGEASLTLDTKVASAGGNLSVGQRQIIALARAMIRGSKVLMLDEGEDVASITYFFYSPRTPK